jgi:hypothetical protein
LYVIAAIVSPSFPYGKENFDICDFLSRNSLIFFLLCALLLYNYAYALPLTTYVQPVCLHDKYIPPLDYVLSHIALIFNK